MTPDIFMDSPPLRTTERAVGRLRRDGLRGSAQSNSGRMIQSRLDAAAGAWDQHLSEYADYGIHPSLYPGVPVRVNTIPTALLVARDLFPEAYPADAFGYSEMWAYLVRTRNVAAWDANHAWVLHERHRIRRYHPFSVRRFAAAAAMHKGVAITSPLRRRRHAIHIGGGVPSDIAGFVTSVGAS
jgi:hypothetical protein